MNTQSGDQGTGAFDRSRACPVCRGDVLRPAADLHDLPVYCNVLWPTREAAQRAARGRIDLAACESCGHIYNRAYDEKLTDYTPDYENSLHYSGLFSRYADELSDRLIRDYDLRGKNLVEIGCGKGDFLKMMCRKGGNQGWGFDRSFEPDRTHVESAPEVTFVQEFYRPELVPAKIDFVCCQHVLEHIGDPRSFVFDLRAGADAEQDTVYYFEVPNALFSVRDLGIWDLIYEHCSYFSPYSLVYLFADAGFEVHSVREDFGGQYLSVEARARKDGRSGKPDGGLLADTVLREIDGFRRRLDDKIDHWRQRLAGFAGRGEKTLAWGAGSKGVTFLNLMDKQGAIDGIVDLNPHKHGKFVPGTAQRVIAPDELRSFKPDHLLVMNGLYLEEIRAMVGELGLDCQFHTV